MIENQCVNLFCGVPGSGKDYCAKTFDETKDFEIMSLDKIRIQKYKELKPNDHSQANRIYHKAFKLCNKKNINLMKFLAIDLEAAIKAGKSVNISVTAGTPKSRAKYVEIIRKIDPDILINCYFITAPVELCIERDHHRMVCDKSIGEELIRTFDRKNIVPTEEEGFNKLIIYENNVGVKPGGVKEKEIEDIEIEYDEIV